MAFYHHPYSADRAYLITSTTKYFTTTDTGRSWNPLNAPTPPNTFRAQVLRFHPDSDKLIWTGNRNCENIFDDCHAEAQYTRNNGRNWDLVEKYVVNCAWATDTKLNADPTEIICESYQKKGGSQRFFQNDNPLELVEGQQYFKKKKKLFNEVVGFAKFSEFLVVAEVSLSKRSFVTVGADYLVAVTCPAFLGSSSIARWCKLCNWTVPTEHAPRDSCTCTTVYTFHTANTRHRLTLSWNLRLDPFSYT